MIGKCPICGEPITVKYTEEYQGERPHGGFVSFVDELVQTCKCELTDEQEEEVIDNTEPEEDPNVDRYINDVE